MVSTAKPPRVLAVDNDPDTLRLVSIKLRRAGYEILTSLTGNEGLALALAEQPEVVLTEVLLAGINGLDLVAEIRQQLGAAAPITILMGRDGSEAGILAGLAVGADDFIVKPFSPRELLVRIKVALARSQLKSASTGIAATLVEREA